MMARRARSCGQRIGIALLAVFVMCHVAWAQQGDPCADSLEPLLGFLARASDDSTRASFGRAAVISGASLSLAFDSQEGYHIPHRQRLSWPGSFFAAFDSNYVPVIPDRISRAQKLLLELIRSGRGALILSPQPVYVYAADTTFGEPWFLVSSCRAGQADSSIWELSEFRRRWWLWTDDPAANTIWPDPRPLRLPRGRSVVLDGLRRCVLAARPVTSGSTSSGLAAFAAGRVGQIAGDPRELLRMGEIRRASAAYLLSALDLWPPSEREPLRLAGYHLQKSAAAWIELAARASDWPLLSVELRDELQATLQTHETGAAVALDGLVSAPSE